MQSCVYALVSIYRNVCFIKWLLHLLCLAADNRQRDKRKKGRGGEKFSESNCCRVPTKKEYFCFLGVAVLAKEREKKGVKKLDGENKRDVESGGVLQDRHSF